MSVVEDVWRRESRHVLTALLRRHGEIVDCEDAAQDALVAAVEQWPMSGLPDNPRGWLIQVARRKLVDREAPGPPGRGGRRPRRVPRSRAPSLARSTTRWRWSCCAATPRSAGRRRWR